MPQINLYTLLELVGKLNDNSGPDSASFRLRRFLEENIKTVDDVRSYVGEALAQSGDQYNKALQDLINHIGKLLGFDVEFGRYRGVKGEIGFDGLWRSPSGLTIVAEAKTTDVYAIRTATLLGYINSLISEGYIPKTDDALGLYIYGRFDTGTTQLENAIIVEGRRERLRVASVEALLQILELKQDYNLVHKSILRLLLPAPVKVDAIVNLIFDIVAQEKEESEIAPSLEEINQEVVSEIEQSETDESENGNKKKQSSSLITIDENYTGKSVRALFIFRRQYEVQTWKEVSQTVLKVLQDADRENFLEKAVTLLGRKRPYISSEKEKLRQPELIPGTNLYFETNLSANSMAKLCYTLLDKMGYSKSDLRIETEE